MKLSTTLLFSTLLVSPWSAMAQEQSEENSVEVVQTELLGLLKAKGFRDAHVERILAIDDAIVIEGLVGTADSSSFKFGRIEVKGIDAGYRWTRAEQVSFSNVDITVGANSWQAEALLSNGFGILDVDSGQPGFAFDELAVVNGQWKYAAEPFLSVSSLVAKGRQWKELYSIPATLDLKASVTFSGPALLTLLEQMSLPMDGTLSVAKGKTYGAEVTGKMSSITSTGSLTAALQVKTDTLGTHKFEAMLGGVDDGLLGSYFGRGDENVSGDEQKLSALKSELDRQIADVSVKTFFYQGQNLAGFDPILSGHEAIISSVVAEKVNENSSEKVRAKNQKLIAEPISHFLTSPNRLEVDIIPERGATLSTFFGVLSSPEDGGRRLLDILGAQVLSR